MRGKYGTLAKASPADLQRDGTRLLIFCLSFGGILLGFSRPGVPWKLSLLFVALAAWFSFLTVATVGDVESAHQIDRGRVLMAWSLAATVAAVIFALWTVAWWAALIFIAAGLGAAHYANRDQPESP